MIVTSAQHVPVPLLVLAVGAAGVVVYSLVDLSRADAVRYLPKWAWAMICVVSIPIGGIIYLAVGRNH